MKKGYFDCLGIKNKSHNFEMLLIKVGKCAVVALENHLKS